MTAIGSKFGCTIGIVDVAKLKFGILWLCSQCKHSKIQSKQGVRKLNGKVETRGGEEIKQQDVEN